MTAKTKQASSQSIGLVILGWVLCVIFGVILICNLTIIIKGSVNPDRPPSVLGVTPMVTLSASMAGDQEDSFNAGDLIFVRETEPERLQARDVISYMEGSIVVSHRIMSVQTAEDGSIEWITKGDANNSEDTRPVSERDLVGKYWFHVPKLGHFALFMQKPLGMALFIGVPLLAFVIYDIIRRQRSAVRETTRTAEMQAEIERLRALAGETDPTREP